MGTLRARIAAFLLCSCAVDLAVPPEAVVTCASDADCPAELECRTSISRCMPRGGDARLPGVVTDSVRLTRDGQDVGLPLRSGAGSVVGLSFEVDEALAVVPSVRLGAPTRPAFVLREQGGRRFSFDLQPTASAGSGAWPILITLTDRVGNVAPDISSATLILDFEAPTATFATAHLEPEPGNPLAVTGVSRARDGAVVTLSFGSNEPLAGAPTVELRCDTVLVGLAAESAAGRTFFVYEATVDATWPEGTCIPQAELTDDAGNRTLVDLPATVEIDRQAPDAAVIDVARFRHLRAPWGAAQLWPPGQVITRDALATLEDPLAALIDAGAVDETAEPIVQLRVHDAGGALLGIVRPRRGADAVEGWEATRLGSLDAREVWLAAIDGAGNESARRRLEKVTWVASLAGKRAGSVIENPHELEARHAFDASALAGFGEPLGDDAAALRAIDGAGLTTWGRGRWRASLSGLWPGPRVAASAVHDPVAGGVSVLGGTSCSGCDGAWTWDGIEWRHTTLGDPEGDGSPAGQLALAYDLERHLFIAVDGTSVWEGDGTSFRRRAPLRDSDPSLPPTRMAASLAYDAARRVTVMFGGQNGADRCTHAILCGDTWTWDGSAWRDATPAPGTCAEEPGARFAAGMVYDEARGQVVMFAGMGDLCGGSGSVCADLWTWDGTCWNRLASGGDEPPPRGSPGLAYDAVRDELVAHGGWGEVGWLEDTWVYGASGWAPVGTSGMGPRAAPATTYDPARGRVVSFAGSGCGVSGDQPCNDLWEWDGTTWSRRGPLTGAAPVGRTYPLVAVDGTGNVVVLGGFRNSCEGASGEACGSTWLYTGGAWQLACDASAGCPAELRRTGAGIAYDAGRDRVVVFGGRSSDGLPLGDIWEWDGAAWTERCDGVTEVCATAPSPRYSPSMAYDSARGVIVVFGGDFDNHELWEWNGGAGTWLQRCDGVAEVCALEPPGRAEAGMAYDARRQRLVVFGGVSPACFVTMEDSTCNDLWEWDPALGAWAERTPTLRPGRRAAHAMGFVASRGLIVIYGGRANDFEPLAEQRLWTWDGEAFGQEPYLVGEPQPGVQVGAGAAYDPQSGTFKLVAGSSDDTLDQIWEWDGAGTRPAHVAALDLRAAGVADECDVDADCASPAVCVTALHSCMVVDEVALRWMAGGAGAAGAGAQAFLWRDGRAWQQRAEHTAGPTSPAGLDIDATDDSQVLRAGHVIAAVAPSAPAGDRLPAGEIVTDQVELRFSYRRGPSPPP